MIKPMAFLLSFALVLGASEPWVLTKDKNRISTYIGNPGQNGLRPTRSVMAVSGSPEMALKVILDIASYPRWIPYCESTKMLDRPNDSTFFYYQFMDMPLVKNRDLIVKVISSKIASGYSITMRVAPDHIPVDEDAVRIAIFTGDYTIEQQGTDSTLITFDNMVDPDGLIPDFVLNWASRSQPFKTFSNLKEHMANYGK
ncbi:MAG: hypothetical protein GC178_04850 [Flavobacteriales bacterium]|nr:hypothetical protein [Flavobacteriales bacterium]